MIRYASPTAARLSVASALLAAVAGLALWSYGLAMLLDMRQESARLSGRGAVLAAEAESLQALERLFASVEPERRSVDALFLDADRVVSFIEALEASGRDAGVRLDIQHARLPAAASESAGSAATMEIALAAGGTFRDMFHFLELVELLPYQLQVTDLRLAALTANGSGLWETQLRLRAFNYTVRTP